MHGKVFKYGDSVDTDVILPARYLALYLPEDLARHCFEDLDPDFVSKVEPGDIVVAGENFGCGSSREHAPLAIKSSGISCVIARSFARIFFRNAINIGLPIFTCPQAVDNTLNGDTLEINLKKGVILNLRQNQDYKIDVFPPFIQKIIDAGGLLASIVSSNSSRH
jgi:3-isopropylmalate/(R)-2-methylmalate dehydratase small subunit